MRHYNAPMISGINLNDNEVQLQGTGPIEETGTPILPECTGSDVTCSMEGGGIIFGYACDESDVTELDLLLIIPDFTCLEPFPCQVLVNQSPISLSGAGFSGCVDDTCNGTSGAFWQFFNIPIQTSCSAISSVQLSCDGTITDCTVGASI